MKLSEDEKIELEIQCLQSRCVRYDDPRMVALRYRRQENVEGGDKMNEVAG